MSAELKGKVISVLPIETGTGKNGKEWKKQTFAIETESQYPKKVAFEVWNDQISNLEGVGTEVVVKYDAESREYNNKWYTQLKAYNIVTTRSTAGGSVEDKQEQWKAPDTDTLPF